MPTFRIFEEHGTYFKQNILPKTCATDGRKMEISKEEYEALRRSQEEKKYQTWRREFIARHKIKVSEREPLSSDFIKRFGDYTDMEIPGEKNLRAMYAFQQEEKKRKERKTKEDYGFKDL